jgi:hypothetical protein
MVEPWPTAVEHARLAPAHVPGLTTVEQEGFDSGVPSTSQIGTQ